MSKGIITIEQRQRQVISRLKKENQKLRNRVFELEKENKDLREKLENVLLHLAELEEIIFGKKKKKKDNDKYDKPNSAGSSNGGNHRDRSSYSRPAPTKEEVTDIEEHKIGNCPDCGTPLTKKQTIIRYIEDIRLDCLNGSSGSVLKIKQVIEQRIEKGYCPKCKKWHPAISISSKITRAGPKVRMFIAYAINILRLSYEQTKNVLTDLYGFNISDGEIANILEKTAVRLNPELERLKERILSSNSVHLDETGHQTGSEKNYDWVMASGLTEEAVFLIGKSRGKGNAVDLLKSYKGVRVTDCYGAYKNLHGEHQVCWSHIIRKARDLKDNNNLNTEKREFAKSICDDLKSIYGKIITAKNGSGEQKSPDMIPALENELDIIINRISSSRLSLKKLSNLGKQMQAYKKQLFTCLKYQGIDETNNKAERKLRHLVLKRKISFGTKTKKGDKILETNLSVLLSLWWQDRKNFFSIFNQLMGA
jgi:transposase